MKIPFSLALVSFSNGIPVGFGQFDAMHFHPRIYEFVLAATNSAESVQVIPQIDIEAIANGIDQSRHRLFRQIVVVFSRTIAECRNVNRDHVLAADLRNGVWRLRSEIRFENLAFDAISAQLHRLVAAEVVHEPLPQVGVKLDIYADLAHGINVLMPWFTYTKLRKISELCGIKRP